MKLVDNLGLRAYEGAVGFFSGPVDKDFRRSLQFAPIHAGVYRIKTSAWSFWWDRGTVVPPARPESFMLSVWLPDPGPRFDHSASRRLGMFDVPSIDSSIHEFTSWLEADEELLFEAAPALLSIGLRWKAPSSLNGRLPATKHFSESYLSSHSIPHPVCGLPTGLL
jgi:hypothetical protein